VSQKKRCCRILAISLSNRNRFSKLFHCKKDRGKNFQQTCTEFQTIIDGVGTLPVYHV